MHLVGYLYENFLYLVIPFYENRAVYDKMWKNVTEPDRIQLTVL
jgi:hypothetical protein